MPTSNGQEAARKALQERKALLLCIKDNLNVSTEDRKRLWRSLSSFLPLTNVVIWQREVYPIAVRGADQFTGTRLVERMTKYQPEYWVFNGFKPLHKDQIVDCAVLFPLADESLGVAFFKEAMNGDHEFSGSFTSARVGELIPKSLTSVIAMRSFLEQRLAADEPVLLPRNERRLIAKQQGVMPDIRVISLRLKEQSGWHSMTARHYRHRWITCGHWMRLPEPLKRDSKRSGGRKGDEVVWRVAHEKGPIGAPLLPQRQTVYSVNR